jgi:ATP-dependent Clp protease ATP-binding subunit ClpA
LRAAARRNREGASGPVQHPVAGDGQRPLTDHHGKTVDFRNVILIMTTNAGASRHGQGGHRLRHQYQQGGCGDEAVKKLFTPEFRNRLDAIVPFGYLPTEVVARVVDKFILQLELQLADRDVHIKLGRCAQMA